MERKRCAPVLRMAMLSFGGGIDADDIILVAEAGDTETGGVGDNMYVVHCRVCVQWYVSSQAQASVINPYKPQASVAGMKE